MSQSKTMLADSKKTHIWNLSVTQNVLQNTPNFLCNSQYNVPLPAACRRLIFYLVRSTLPIIYHIPPPSDSEMLHKTFSKYTKQENCPTNLIVTSANALSSKHINATNPAQKGFLCKFFHDAMQINILVTF